MAPMRARSVAAARASRPWLTFLVGGAVGFAILILTQVLSDTRLEIGPWALNGNGALAVPFVGFPLAIYVGWTTLADRHDGRDLVIQLVVFSLGLTLGAWVLGALFAMPVALATAAIYAIWMRGSAVKRSDRLLWAAFGASIVVGAYASELSVPASTAADAAGLVYWETGAVADRLLAGEYEGALVECTADGRATSCTAVRVDVE